MTNGNDEAYPRAGFFHDADTYDVGSSGLSKREYFAAMAMQGLLANATNMDKEIYKFDVTDEAVMYADYLIESLNDGGAQPEPAQTDTTTETTGSEEVK